MMLSVFLVLLVEELIGGDSREESKPFITQNTNVVLLMRAFCIALFFLGRCEQMSTILK